MINEKKKTLMKDDNLSNYFSVSDGMSLLHIIFLCSHILAERSNIFFHFVKYKLVMRHLIICYPSSTGSLQAIV